MSSPSEGNGGAAATDHSTHLTAAEGALVRVDDVVAGYTPGINILNNCDLYCHRGEIVGIIGPNGAGKSTLVKAIFGLVEIRSGVVTLDGNDITNAKPNKLVSKGVGYVPQTNNVFPSLTIEENLPLFKERFAPICERAQEHDLRIALNSGYRAVRGALFTHVLFVLGKQKRAQEDA